MEHYRIFRPDGSRAGACPGARLIRFHEARIVGSGGPDPWPAGEACQGQGLWQNSGN